MTKTVPKTLPGGPGGGWEEGICIRLNNNKIVNIK